MVESEDNTASDSTEKEEDTAIKSDTSELTEAAVTEPTPEAEVILVVTKEDEAVAAELGVTEVEAVIKESSKVTEVADDLDLEEASKFNFLAYLEKQNLKYKQVPRKAP